MELIGASAWSENLSPRPDQQLQAVVTCIRLDDPRVEPRFQALVVQIIAQLADSPGLVGWSMADAKDDSHLTLSAWRDGRSLAAFMRTSPHVDVMGELREAGRVTVARFDARGLDVPLSWDDALGRLH